MDNIVMDKPNLQPEVVPVQEASTGLDAIASKMAAMKSQTLRNQMQATEQAGTGVEGEAESDIPVAPEGIVEDNDTELNEPEVADPEAFTVSIFSSKTRNTLPIATCSSSDRVSILNPLTQSHLALGIRPPSEACVDEAINSSDAIQ